MPAIDTIIKDAALQGETDNDKKAVADYVAKAGELVKDLHALNATLIPKTYIAGNAPTAADAALYAALHPIFASTPLQTLFSTPAVVRYFDHIQNLPIVGGALSAVQIDLANAPAPERKVEAPKKKEKKPAAAEAGAPAEKPKKGKGKAVDAPAPTEAAVAETAEKPAKKGKKEAKEPKEDPAAAAAAGKKNGVKKEKKAKAPAAPAVEDGPPAPSMIDLRVGIIREIMKHPDADGLYVEQVDVGEEAPRTIVSGLVNYIPIEQMQNQHIVVVCNLKPASMRGIKSYGMVLCATSKEGKEGGIELVKPPASSPAGARIYFEGGDYEGKEPLALLNPKKKIFEAVQPGFTTLDSREAAWVNPETKTVHKIRTAEGVCEAPTLVGASLS